MDTKLDTKFEISVEVSDQLLLDLMQNFPESAQYCFACTDYDYYKGAESSVGFEDTETGKLYRLTIPAMREGFKILMREVLNGKLPGLPFDGCGLLDGSAWDAYCLDALVQCSLIGEVVYG